MDMTTFTIILMFLWIINTFIMGALYFIYKSKKILFLDLTIGYSILFLSYIFLLLRIGNETYINMLFANLFYLIGNIFVIKGLYKYLNIKESLNFKNSIIITILYALIFTFIFRFNHFYFRNILNALFPMIIYLIIIIKNYKIDKNIYIGATFAILIVHILTSIFRIIYSITAGSLLDFEKLITFNVGVYAVGQLSLVFLGQVIVIGVFYSTVKQLEKTVIHDDLTELFNRKKIDDSISLEINRSNRYNSVFSLMMIDIDDFKSINDTYGHQIGDRVLKEFACVLKSSIRNTDIAGRWGGDEFIVLFPESNKKDVLKIGNNLCKEIAEKEFYNNVKMTSSFGVSTFLKGDSMESIFERADRALYKSKSSGKNTVVHGEFSSVQ